MRNPARERLALDTLLPRLKEALEAPGGQGQEGFMLGQCSSGAEFKCQLRG